jgi:hypothetical protein
MTTSASMSGTLATNAYVAENPAMARLVTSRMRRFPNRSASAPVKGALTAEA